MSLRSFSGGGCFDMQSNTGVSALAGTELGRAACVLALRKAPTTLRAHERAARIAYAGAAAPCLELTPAHPTQFDVSAIRPRPLQVRAGTRYGEVGQPVATIAEGRQVLDPVGVPVVLKQREGFDVVDIQPHNRPALGAPRAIALKRSRPLALPVGAARTPSSAAPQGMGRPVAIGRRAPLVVAPQRTEVCGGLLGNRWRPFYRAPTVATRQTNALPAHPYPMHALPSAIACEGTEGANGARVLVGGALERPLALSADKRVDLHTHIIAPCGP